MPILKTTRITDFPGGISDDIREVNLTKFSIAKHFDTTTNPKKLIPYRSTEAETFGATVAAGNFLYNSAGQLCALGKDAGHNWFAILFKSGASLITDTFAGGVWAGTEGVAQTTNPFFIEYNAKMYFCQFVTPNYELVSALVANPYTVDEAIGNLVDSDSNPTAPTGKGLVHSKSNTLFIPVKNCIAKVTSAGAFTANAAPPISSTLSITSLSEYGSYLAIGCRDTTRGNSKLIIWDMVSTTTFLDVIDWGREALYVINNLEGYIIGISCTPNDVFIGDFARIAIKSWGGGKPSLIKEITAKRLGGTPAALIYNGVNFISNDKLHFAAYITDGTNSYIGIWTVGRKNSAYPFAVNFDRFVTTDNSETSIINAILLGDYLWACHTAANTVTRTDDQANYLATSIYESQKFNGELHGFDSSYTKNLVSVSMTCDKLPANATLTLEYRVNGATAWTTHMTISTTDAISQFLDKGIGDYKEIEWRIESYKGAICTGLEFTEEFIGKRK